MNGIHCHLTPDRVVAFERYMLKTDATLNLILRAIGHETMITKDHLSQLSNNVAANTSLVASINQTLAGLVSANHDLTLQLQSAAANGDDDAVKAAIDALAANNAAMAAAVPSLVQSAIANTGTPADTSKDNPAVVLAPSPVAAPTTV